MQDARQRFRLNAQLRGDQAFGQVEVDHTAARCLQFLEQVTHHALADVGRGQAVDLVQALVESVAEAAEQLHAQLRLGLEQTQVVGVLHVEHQAFLEGGGAQRMFGLLVEEQRLGKGLARPDYLDDLLLTIAGDPVQLDLAVDQHVKVLGRVALMEQRAAGRQALDRGMRREVLQSRLGQPIEQMMTAHRIEHCRAGQHGHPPSFR